MDGAVCHGHWSRLFAEHCCNQGFRQLLLKRMHGKRLLFSFLSHSPSEKNLSLSFLLSRSPRTERQETKNGVGSLPWTLVSSVCRTLLQSRVSPAAPKEDAWETIALLFPL